MGITYYFMGKMGGVPKGFLQDHAGGHDRAADVSDRFWNGDPDTPHTESLI